MATLFMHFLNTPLFVHCNISTSIPSLGLAHSSPRVEIMIVEWKYNNRVEVEIIVLD